MSYVSVTFTNNTTLPLSIVTPLAPGKSTTIKLTDQIGSTQFTINEEVYQIFNSQIWAGGKFVDLKNYYTFRVQIAEAIDTSQATGNDNGVIIDIRNQAIGYYINYNSGLDDFQYWVTRANNVLISDDATIGVDDYTQNIVQVEYDKMANSVTIQVLDEVPKGFSEQPQTKKIKIPWDRLIVVIMMTILVSCAIIVSMYAIVIK